MKRLHRTIHLLRLELGRLVHHDPAW
jgi:hypothetical protein